MDYASPVWASAHQNNINKIQIVQNWALRTLSGAPWFVRNVTLHSDFEIDDIPTHLMKRSRKFFESCEQSVYPQVRQIGRHKEDHQKYRMPKDLIKN